MDQNRSNSEGTESDSQLNKLSSINKFIKLHENEIQGLRSRVKQYKTQFVDQLENLVKLDLPQLILEINDIHKQLDREQIRKYETRVIDNIRKDINANFELPAEDSMVDYLFDLYRSLALSNDKLSKLHKNSIYMPNQTIAQNDIIYSIYMQLRPKLMQIVDLFWRIEVAANLLKPTVEHYGNSGVVLQSRVVDIVYLMQFLVKKLWSYDGWYCYARKRINLIYSTFLYPQSIDARLSLETWERSKLRYFKRHISELLHNMILVQHILQLNLEVILKPRLDLNTKICSKLYN